MRCLAFRAHEAEPEHSLLDLWNRIGTIAGNRYLNSAALLADAAHSLSGEYQPRTNPLQPRAPARQLPRTVLIPLRYTSIPPLRRHVLGLGHPVLLENVTAPAVRKSPARVRKVRDDGFARRQFGPRCWRWVRSLRILVGALFSSFISTLIFVFPTRSHTLAPHALPALGIGFHSYHLLLEALQPTLQHAPAAIQAFSTFTGQLAEAGAHLHDHPDASANDADWNSLLDPNAMWFALASVLVKEWLYRATLKIAREENSSVLEVSSDERFIT